MPSNHPFRIIPRSLVHAHTKAVCRNRKRNQLTRRLPTYHAKQRQCPNGFDAAETCVLAPTKGTRNAAAFITTALSTLIYSRCQLPSLVEESTCRNTINTQQRRHPTIIVRLREMRSRDGTNEQSRDVLHPNNVPASLRVL